MKRKGFIVLSVLFICCLCGCSFFSNNTYLISNNSSFEISFSINNNEYSLSPNESIELNNFPNSDVILHEKYRVHKRTDYINYNYYKICYTDLQQYQIEIFNPTNYDLILSEKNGMLGDNYGDKIMLLSNEITKSCIFTQTPQLELYYEINNFNASLDIISYKIY